MEGRGTSRCRIMYFLTLFLIRKEPHMKKLSGIIVLICIVGTFLVLTGCSKEKAENSEESTHMHQHEAVQKDAQETSGKSQTTCPVMGGEIDKKIFEDHKGKRVYLCCEACREEFKKSPEKYIKKLEDAGITLANTP